MMRTVSPVAMLGTLPLVVVPAVLGAVAGRELGKSTGLSASAAVSGVRTTTESAPSIVGG